MITLKYKFYESLSPCTPPFLLLAGIECGDPDSVKISVPKGNFGFVLIAGRKYRIENQCASIPFEEIPYGSSDINITYGTKILFATPFEKKGGTINRLPMDDKSFEILETTLDNLLRRVTEAEKSILALRAKTEPVDLFNFN